MDAEALLKRVKGELCFCRYKSKINSTEKWENEEMKAISRLSEEESSVPSIFHISSCFTSNICLWDGLRHPKCDEKL